MKIDLIVKNAYVFQTYRQCFEKRDFMVADGRIYSISPDLKKKENSGEAAEVIDAAGKYVIPGLIDIHMHIESSMTYPIAFSNAVLKYGVTSVVADPHEIANVFGIDGIRAFMKQRTTLDIFYGIPSSVPSVDEKTETNGASIGVEEVRELLQDRRVLCLGEVMNYADISSEDSTKIKDIIACCKDSIRPIRIEGHCPKLSHDAYNRFIFEGVDSDHTQQTPESLLEKIDLGMFVELQKKSLSKEVIDTIRRYRLYESIALVTDDTMPDDLMKGHLNEIVKYAISLGMPVEQAIYCATYTSARRMFLTDRGVIAPGKIADFVILDDLQSFHVESVYKAGIRVEEITESKRESLFPLSFYHSIHCSFANSSDFEVKVESIEKKEVAVHVISLSDTGTFTEKKVRTLPVNNGKVCWEGRGLSMITIFERYGKNGNIAHGFVENALVKRGAIATTWSHDSHNLLVLGNSVADMVRAQQEIVSRQGGYCIASNEKIIACADLPVGGIISDRPVSEIAEQIQHVREAIEELGYKNTNVIMSVSTLALVVSPDLKMTDKGLFSVKEHCFKKLII